MMIHQSKTRDLHKPVQSLYLPIIEQTVAPRNPGNADCRVSGWSMDDDGRHKEFKEARVWLRQAQNQIGG